MHDPGVVEHHVQLSELLLGDGHHRLTIGRSGDITCHPYCGATLINDFLGNCLDGFLIEIDANHRSSLGGEEPGRLSANSTGGAGDQGDLVLEPSHQIRSK